MVVRLQRIAVLLLVLACAGVSAPTHALPHVVPIAKARSLRLDTVVTVDGTATTPSGAFETSFFDKGFAIQGHRAGSYVGAAADLDIEPRDRFG